MGCDQSWWFQMCFVLGYLGWRSWWSTMMIVDVRRLKPSSRKWEEKTQDRAYHIYIYMYTWTHIIVFYQNCSRIAPTIYGVYIGFTYLVLFKLLLPELHQICPRWFFEYLLPGLWLALLWAISWEFGSPFILTNWKQWAVNPINSNKMGPPR